MGIHNDCLHCKWYQEFKCDGNTEPCHDHEEES